MKIYEVLNQNKRGMGYFRSSWNIHAFIQMSYTSGIYTLYEVRDTELFKSPFEFSQEDIDASDWQVDNLCALESKLLSIQEANKNKAS
ncbi:hypothetical protein CQA38_09000 [Campylobacter sp. MIT 12-5580]|uniref:Thoeris anti-defense Tad2 family protein n=1 Tax=unclassified Campylobacter TaxID=2593542 RepID=UPI0010F596EC|nr:MULTISPECIES: hypothetical protein [unclassified Campylobacter]NDJ27276.1 hypothetical protein [Campylobacter sp. MIT 19-121]TKX28160.1 hypothetical protein CQA38_09000 [Campylobacter sp. MIT 12-5580]